VTGRSGYPKEHWEVVYAAWRWAGLTVLVTGVPAAALALFAIRWNGSLHLAAVAAAIFAVGTFTAVAGTWDCWRYVRVIPYFEGKVGGIDTFLGGSGIARSLLFLDELAAEGGVAPLSAFGFHDDLRGETVGWHPPEEGLRTVETLLAAVDTEPGRVSDPEAVRRDLSRIAEALRRAADLRIRFSLLLLHGNATSGLEWERRIGSAF
jgi:hypothetical protein